MPTVQILLLDVAVNVRPKLAKPFHPSFT
jgi:hypothetical protein